MKKVFVFAIMSMTLAACGGNKSEQDAAADSARIADSIAQVEAAAQAEAERFAGTYAGLIPAADADGYEVNLVLNTDMTFNLEQVVKGSKEDGSGSSNSGSFSVSGDTITLALDGDQQAPLKLVSDASADTLRYADVFNEELVPFYVLSKQK